MTFRQISKRIVDGNVKDLRAVVIKDDIKIQNSSKKQKYNKIFYSNNSDAIKVFLISLLQRIP